MGFSLRRLGMPVGGRSPGDPAPEPPADTDLKPSAMRGSEPLYGYFVAFELLFVAVLNMTVTHGKGAPAHPNTTLAAVGIAAVLGFVALMRTRNRFYVGLGVIVAAFFVTLPQVPNSLALAHIFALVIPLVYGLVLTQRQRKATPGRSRGSTAPPRTSGRGSRGRKGQEAAPSGPRPSRRYTPPKSKRQAGKKG